jgi:hypothetical protein
VLWYGHSCCRLFLQVLRYQNGQKYDAHWDWFDDPTHPANSGENRCGCYAHYGGVSWLLWVWLLCMHTG